MFLFKGCYRIALIPPKIDKLRLGKKNNTMTMQKIKNTTKNYFIMTFILSFRSMFKLLLTYAQSYLFSFSLLFSFTLVILNFYFMWSPDPWFTFIIYYLVLNMFCLIYIF